MADQINPDIYGPKLKFPLVDAADAVTNQIPVAPLKQVPLGAAVQGAKQIGQGEQALVSANREEASKLESVGAAVSQWTVGHVNEAFFGPKFEREKDFNAVVALGGVQFPLNLLEEKMLLESQSAEEFSHRLSDMEARQMANTAMGDNQLSAMVGMVADPGYLAISAASLGAGTVARAAQVGSAGAKLAAGAAGFGTALAIGKAEQKVVPLSNTHVFLNAMAFGAAEGLLFKGGKLARADESFPAAALHDTVAAMERESTPQLVTRGDDVVGPVPVHADPMEFVGPSKPKADPHLQSRFTSAQEANIYMRDNKLRAGYRMEQSGRSEWKLKAKKPAVAEAAPEAAVEVAAGTESRVLEVQSAAEIAEHAPSVRAGGTVVDPSAKAVYLPGEDRVFLVRENIRPGDDVKGLLLHEVGVHMNAERVLGTSQMHAMLGRLEEMATKGNKRARAAYAEVPKDTPRHLVAEEALGYYVERNHMKVGDHVVNRFVHAVKEKLRSIGLTGLKLSENDIMQLVRKSAKGKPDVSLNSAFPYAWHGTVNRGIDQADLAFAGKSDMGFGHFLSTQKGEAVAARAKDAERRGMAATDGGVYRVKINAGTHQLVDLESKVQSATVQSAFGQLGVQAGTGKQMYDALAASLGGTQAASAALHDLGVLGNKSSKGVMIFDAATLDTAARYSKASQATGKALEWSLNKTFSSFSKEAEDAAKILLDNPLDLTGNSVASQHRAIRADFAAHQMVFENTVLERMVEQGWGTRKQILQSEKAIAAQNAIERDLAAELSRRNRLSHDGQTISHVGIDPKLKELADQYDVLSKAAFDELQRSGVSGAENLVYHPGYYPRRWDNVSIEAIQSKLVAQGMTEQAARKTLQDSISISIQRATGMDAEIASDVALATLDRARRKGYFEDSAFRGTVGADAAAEIRDILTASGVANDRVERALQVMTAKSDEAGKASMLKHRVDMALDEPIGASGHTIMDMLDTRLVHLTEHYLDKTAATAAFARKGLTRPSDVTALRSKVLESIPEQGKRADAAKLFDNTVAALRGEPVGEDVNRAMRISRGLTQMVGLKGAGLFQFTEFSTILARHGMAATVKNMVKEFPGIRTLLSDPLEAGHLRDVLVRNCTEDQRLRPFVSRMEDNFNIESTERAQLSIMQAKQLVPYMNGLKYVQKYQARISGNLMVKTLEKAAAGDVKALATLEQYGLESHIMGAIRNDLTAHGMNTLKWSDATWDAVRGPMNKMLDDLVLRTRVGELPAFAQFSTLGKFLFTFRNFVLGAHNKVLAGTLNRKGFAGIGLILAYQLPMMYLMTHVDQTVVGRKPKSEEDLIKASLTQAGALGLLSEAVGVALGNKKDAGAPGLIALDRLYKLGAAVGSGDPGNIGAATYNATPLLSVVLPLRAIPEALKSDTPQNK